MAPMFLAVLLILAASFYRVMPHSENFAPLSAIAICGGMYLSKRMSLVVVLGLMLVSDIWVNLVKYNAEYGLFPVETLGHYAGFLGALLIGWTLRQRKTFWNVMCGTSAASVQFFIFSNLMSWWMNPAYAKNIAGFLQCFTVGIPGYPTTIEFFLKTLASDLMFTGLFVAVSELAIRGLPKSKFEWLLVKV